ncbi:MAG: RNA polymerase sigma factor [Defluviitaleaceae bacterium]|nr:RNA polymerase sigma factor [Defluviitaleaceae bacterium]
MEALRDELIAYIRKKFYTRPNILQMVDDIVNQAFLDVGRAAGFVPEHYNFGYMSTACIRAAYKAFHKGDREGAQMVGYEQTEPLVDERCFVAEIEQAEDTAFIIQSLCVLKDIERVIVEERYYGDFTFKEIAERTGIKLNTVLSHHRRALERMRPVFTKYFDYSKGADYYD